MEVMAVPDYETHLSVAAIVGLAAGFITYSIFVQEVPTDYATMAGMVAFTTVCVGGVLPDVDHHVSKPRRLLNAGLVLTVGAAVHLTVVGPKRVSTAPPELHLLGVVLGFFVMIPAANIVPPVVDAIMPSHRTITHQPVPYFTLLAIPGHLIWKQQLSIPGVHFAYEVLFIAPALLGLFCGVMIHLSLDGTVGLVKRIDNLGNSL